MWKLLTWAPPVFARGTCRGLGYVPDLLLGQESRNDVNTFQALREREGQAPQQFHHGGGVQGAAGGASPRRPWEHEDGVGAGQICLQSSEEAGRLSRCAPMGTG